MSNVLDQFDIADKATPYASTDQKPGNVLDQFDVAAKSADLARPQVSTKPASISPLGSDIENFSAGAGKAVVDTGRGLKQLMDIPAQFLEKKFPGLSAWGQSLGLPSAADSAEATNADVAQSRVTDAPLMKTKAGFSGNIAGNIATTIAPLGLAAKAGTYIRGSDAAAALMNPANYKSAILAGAMNGAIQPTIGDESKIANIGIGAIAGAGGNLATNMIGRVAQPVVNALSSAHEKAVSVLQNAGIPLDAAQKTGSTFLNKLRSGFSDNPFTAGAQKDLASAQQAGYNKAVLSSIGESASAATPEVMDAASRRINGVFSDVLNRNNVKITDPALSRIASVQAAATEEEKKPVAAIADRLMNAIQADGTIPGQAAYGIKKDLDRLAASPDTTLGYHAKQLRSALMDTINDSLSTTDQAAFSQARGQFRDLKRIEPAIDRMGNGDISAPKLANIMAQKANRGASLYGRGDQTLVDLAHAGNMLLPDKAPNSGSIGRGVMQMALPLAAGGAQGAYTGDWEKAALTAGGMYAVPKAAQYLVNSPATSQYLSQGMQGAMTPIRNFLQLPQTSNLIGGTIRRIPSSFESAK